MELSGKRVLVIGGGGLIGSHVVEQLVQTDVGSVVIYDNFTRGSLANLEDALRDPRVTIFPHGGDILHEDVLDEAVRQSDAVFHLAALWLLHCNEYPQSAFDVNIRGTFNVMEACRRHGIERLVYSSSASVYGDALEEPMTENHPFNCWTFYGATKIAGEAMLKAHHKRYGLKGVGLRYMNVYGPRQDYQGAYVAVMMKALDNIDRNEAPVVFGDGSQAYDFIHVTDIARANLCAMRAECPIGFFNVGRGVKTTIKELIEVLLKLTGREHLGIDFQPAPQYFVTNRVGCPKAAREQLGFEWTIDLEEGMRSLIDWRKHHQEQVAARKRKAGLAL